MVEENRQACATPEIEITPKMIEVGVKEFYKHDNRFEPAEAAVAKIVSAMFLLPEREIRVSLASEVEKSLSPYLTRPEDT
jgi:hypothetical protein